MGTIRNPILRGFNPDPSIIRVEDNYYIATSTFEWFPGVQIYHSKDLQNWKLIKRPLERVSQLDMEGVEDSLGIWAPCLSFERGTYYLVYTVVKSVRGGYMDAHNYLVTSSDIYGDWSEPVYLNSIGFDPSMFHDEDEKKWFVGLTCDNAPGHDWFGGIILQEYCEKEKRLIGKMKTIFTGTDMGFTEGPHLYKKDGWYYLITAEGGTGYNHAVTMARSRNIDGPYEVDPYNPVLSSRNNKENPIQKAGHADIIEAHDGNWYMVHLCGRPVKGRCMLGRETCIQKVYWTDDGWLRVVQGGNSPYLEVDTELPDIKESPIPSRVKYDFVDGELPIDFQTLRMPLDEDTISFSERPGYLRLKGKESLSSLYHQALVARRQQAFSYTAETCVEFEPESYKHMAGLVCYYNTRNYHYLYISVNEQGKCIGVVSCDDGKINIDKAEQVLIEGWEKCYLKAEMDNDILKFSYSKDGALWNIIEYELDSTILSDENCKSGFGFTGAFVGVCCQDLLKQEKHADFKYLSYEEENKKR